MRRYCFTLLTVFLALTALCASASAYAYTFDGAESGAFAAPTADNTAYVAARDNTNTDRSKNAALIPPRFGSPSSYTLNAGELLTPNLVRQPTQVTVSGVGGVTLMSSSSSGGVTLLPSSTSGDTANPFAAVTEDSSVRSRFTAVTSDLYYDDGHAGSHL